MTEIPDPVATHPTMGADAAKRVPQKSGPIVLYNRRRGVWWADHLEPVAPTRGEAEPYKVHRLTLSPGLNLLSAERAGVWKQLRAHNRMADLAVDDGTIVEIGAVARWHKQPKPDRIQQVVNSGDRKTLEALLEDAEQADVVEALEDQVEEMRRKDADDADERREQRRARRKKVFG